MYFQNFIGYELTKFPSIKKFITFIPNEPNPQLPLDNPLFYPGVFLLDKNKANGSLPVKTSAGRGS
jgi:hypothetical protein